MKADTIKDILKMRIAVYKAGVKARLWKDLDNIGATEMMDYIFPKSGRIAYYNLILETVRSEHAIVPTDTYHLFNLPIQVENEIMNYLKKDEGRLPKIDDDGMDYLMSNDTIVTDHTFDVVWIGSFDPENISAILHLCASHYLYSFNNNVKSYPFMS